MARREQLKKLKRRTEVAHRFSLSRSPLLSLITRLKVLAPETSKSRKRLACATISRTKRHHANKLKPLKHKSEPWELQVKVFPEPPKTIGSGQSTRVAQQVDEEKRPRSKQKLNLPDINVEEDLITKIENWQMKSMWENSEEILDLKKEV